MTIYISSKVEKEMKDMVSNKNLGITSKSEI